MPNYGRDFDRSRFGQDRGFRAQGGGSGGSRGGYGGMGSDGFGNGYTGMGSDAGEFSGRQSRDGYTGFGSGGGAYDQDFSSGRGMQRGGGYGQQGGGYGGRPGGMGGGYGGGQGFGGGMERGGSGGYGGGRGYGSGTSGYGGQQDYMGDRGGYGQQGGMGQGGDELRRMRAADIMTENPEVVTPDATLADAARKMRDLDVGIIPVVDSEQNRRLRGVITDRDITIRAVAEGRDAGSTRVSDVMTSGVETCNKNDSVQDVLQLMEREQVRRVPITDREGRLVGIIAQADVATDLDSEMGSRRVADTLERISEPGQPGGRGMQARGGGLTSGGSPMGGAGADSDNG
jgi:CBS domain-containing protein